MKILMENLAHRMTVDTLGGHELLEFVDADAVRQEADLLFTADPNLVLGVLLNSVLTTHTRQESGQVEIFFALRALQEFFLASWLVRHQESPALFPKAVQDFCSEICT